ncbi:6608_t:CDS:2 [Dentiscutata erythropus]|uniref:6608_t:CDS:1 n=1 Tax=Dentiscutata erythropus TaxID=1348616 RepID=A0A9N9AF88_9GLOM|nr:6608_t:CDS:2 [Dentiscutata erythropus]
MKPIDLTLMEEKTGFNFYNLVSKTERIVETIEELKTHNNLFINKENEEPQISKKMALFLLIIVTVIIGFSAKFYVSSIEEHATSVSVAMKDKMEFAICITVGSLIQIMLFVIPLLVILGWNIGQPISLNFEIFKTVYLLISVLLSNYLVQ